MRKRHGISELYASLMLLIIVSSMGVIVYSYTVETTLGYEQYFIDKESGDSKRVQEQVSIVNACGNTSNEVNITIYNYGVFDTAIIEVYVNDEIVNTFFSGINEDIISLGLKKISFQSPITITEGEQYTIIVVSRIGVPYSYIWKK
jgi:hypothetical protein